MADKRDEFRTVSYAEENAKAGLLFAAWTQKWGLKVYPWYSMDRIKFSFIEKGASGKGKSCDVCVNTVKDYAFTFEDFKHEFLHDIETPYDFLQTMAYEKEHPVKNKAGVQMPGRYRFVTGKNGEKYVGIMPSSDGKGYVICGQAVVNGTYVHPMIRVSYYDLYHIVKAYDETYEERRAELKALRLQGMKDVESGYNRADYEEDAPAAALPEESTAETTEETVVQESAPAEEKQEAKHHGIHVTTISEIVKQGDGSYTLTVRKDDGTEAQMRIPGDVAGAINAKKNGLFDKFVAKVNRDGSNFWFTGAKRKTGGQIEYVFAEFC